jgi:S-adenosylmethionine:tRNA ribosyltransferase-isomerase
MHKSILTTADFDYTLPEELVAHEPLPNRSESKLLVHKNGVNSDHSFQEIGGLIPKGSLVIMNDTKVLPGRLLGKTIHGGSIEIMLLEPLSPSEDETKNCRWKALGKPMKKLKADTIINFASELTGKILDRIETHTGPIIHVEFDRPENEFTAWLNEHGFIPLPPYIKRLDPLPASQSPDTSRYQTVFANHSGSVAAPTAGLHFTDKILSDFEKNGIEVAKVTLHVGGGTFLPVKSDDPSSHHMHKEQFTISNMTYNAILKAQEENRPIIAVGTTSFRALQGFHMLAQSHPIETLLNKRLSTDIFIYPKDKKDLHSPWAVKGIMTNFHQPKSTLFMLICALVGYEKAHKIYAHAIEKRYRFYSYGDTSLLWLP